MSACHTAVNGILGQVLLIHPAGQLEPKTVASPTNLMLVHDFVAAQIRAMSQ